MTEQLIPPILSVETVQERLACVRPVREGCPNISVEAYGSRKHIVHCYGHGGSGWTLLFGSVNAAMAKFLSANPSKHVPIRVIGAGCMGLLCATELFRQGYRVSGITARELVDIPSWQAAGYFALVSLKTTPEESGRINQMGMQTFLGYQEIGEGKHPFFGRENVRLLPVYSSPDTETGVEGIAEAGLVPPPEEVTLDFGRGVRHEGYLKYFSYFINGTQMMLDLMREVKRCCIPVEKRTIHSFDDVAEEWIFNCSGMGAQELNADKKLTPVKGHLITLKPSSGRGHMDYMIYTDLMQDDIMERLYLFPKKFSVTPQHPAGIECAGVLGGTFVPTDGSRSYDDNVEFRRILDRASMFFYGHPFR